MKPELTSRTRQGMKNYTKGMHVIEFTFSLQGTLYTTEKHVFLSRDLTTTREAYEFMDSELEEFTKHGMAISKAKLA